MDRREILKEIDATLDQLIENAAALKEVSEDSHLAALMSKTQESLLARLIHLNHYLEKVPQAVHNKRALLTELSAPTARRKHSKQTIKH